MNRGDSAGAEKAFDRAVQDDPTNPEYEADRMIAHEHGVTQLVQQAAKERLKGQPQAANAKLAEALAMDPKNSEVSQHIDDLSDPASPAPASEDPTATIAPPIALEPARDLKSFHLKDTEQAIVRQVLAAYGVTAVVDSSIPTQKIRFDADNVDYAHAAELLELATDSFLVPLDPKRALAAKDTKENRANFERVAVETLRLPGLSASEMTDMGNIAKNVIGIQQSSLRADAGTLTVRAPGAEIAALNRTFADLLDGRSEVLLEVRLYQVEKTKTLDIGVQLPQSVTVFNADSEINSALQGNESLVQQIISSGLVSAGDLAGIAAILIASGEVTGSILTQPFAVFGGGLTESGLSVGPVQGNLSLNSTDTRELDQIQMRLEDDEEGTIRSGTRYPIITSSYSSISGTGVSIPGLNSSGISSVLSGLGVNLSSLSAQQPIPQVQYQDLGLTLKVTPRIERTNQVVLNLDFKIEALEGTELNGLPLLTNRSYTADVEVPNGSSALVVGDLSRTESNAVTGLPGLDELPGFQSATNSEKEYDVSDLVIVVTPRIVRRRHSEIAGPFIPLPRHG